jgi:hypothetical protein
MSKKTSANAPTAKAMALIHFLPVTSPPQAHPPR